ncbi:molybdenum cofactor biosynthesis protein MoaE [Agrobacterium sp. Azo12]|uniref:molybdenum cofactor biosynthesis protein MoaE n=1 Tax=Agrobacterium sp. Azo12 TaxID=3031129 RepID=UPI0023D896B1|nr:molybdenum cofactor biosynthesis protein MoaE [Agrobacterium sp. Azo12]MDO5895018.1 molybdenum cofactor biosynthesis protein MoaE [Agrobacterium sp. Azo12]
MKPTICVQSDDFDAAAEAKKLTDNDRSIGAVVTFTGLCRDDGGTLSALELEHYPGMAEAELNRIAALAIERFDLLGLTAIHRFGKIPTGDNIVLVIAASRHRQAAFDGANFVMDYLKTSAPFWKKEHGKDGSAGEWINAKNADETAKDKWR